jgi:hypothetical protein
MMASTLARWLWYCSALFFAALPTVDSATGGSTTIFTVQHEPFSWAKNGPPEKLTIVNMGLNGQSADTALKYQSQFLHVGCYSASKSITQDAEQDTSFDPTECIAVCKSKMADTPSNLLIAAVRGRLCGCVNDKNGGMTQFSESDDYDRDCNTPCKYFENTICGGEPDYWGVFKEYDYQYLASPGAYDPWRKIWYTVVIVLERTIDIEIGVTKLLPVKADDTFVSPERYYLHAADRTTGAAAFQYQTRLPGSIAGIQYDLDSSRLVGIMIPAEQARSYFDWPMWTYKLFVCNINTTLPLKPNMSFEDVMPEVFGAHQLDREYFTITGASAIVSKRNLDTYAYVMLEDQSVLNRHKHHIHFVTIPLGEKLGSYGLDLRVVQLFSNEKYGDVSCFGSRYRQMVYVYLGRVYFNTDFMARRLMWMYNPVRPEFLAPEDFTSDFWMYPGASCSEHLFNKSYTLMRNYSTDPYAARDQDKGTKLLEIDIRNNNYAFLCDNDKGCKYSMNVTIPYAGIFNAEPRIPLSLAAPSLLYAQFSIDGGYIMFAFDRATLKGATPVDINNDIVPDSINYDTVMKGQFGCELLFDEDSVVLLGSYLDGTFCEWISESEVRVSLPTTILAPAEVGDSIFLAPDVIYTVPRIEQGEYSMAAAGGIQISMPEPLLDPVILFSGESTVDECSPVYFDAADSYNVGGKPAYNWSLIGQTDLTMRPDRVLNATRMQLLTDKLANATRQNFAIFEMSSKELEPAVRFQIQLMVISRWGPNVTKLIDLIKLDYPAPMVSIVGPEVFEVKRPDEVSMLAAGKASDCPGIDRRLGYKWTETTGKIDLEDFSDIVTTTRSLVIPPFTLHPTGMVPEVNIYNFTIKCYVWTDPERYATAVVSVKVSRSEVFARLGVEDRLLTRGRPLILDARQSQDMDYPTAAEQTFKGTFKWSCLGPAQMPCYADSHLLGLGPNVIGYTDVFAVKPEVFPLCRTDINVKLMSGGRTFSNPLFVDYEYCQWARGVFMGDTTNFTEGNYTMTVEAIAIDGRSDKRSCVITITKYDVPNIFLKITGEAATKYPVTDAIRFEGTIEKSSNEAGLAVDAEVFYGWQILLYGLNNQYSNEEARQAEIEGRLYEQEQYVFTDVSAVLDISNASRFSTRPTIPNMKIMPNVVKPSQTYKMRLILTITNYGISTFTDVSFDTAGLPPRPGQLTCDPKNGTMLLKRIAMAPDWKADDLPLSYHFGYYETLGTEQIQMHFDTTALPISSTSLTQLPIGDASTNYSLPIFVDVYSAFKAKSTLTVQIQSRPPANKTAVVNELMDKINQPGADPEQTVKDINTILDVNAAPKLAPGATMAPADVELMEKIISILQTVSESAPVTKQMQMQQVAILTKVVESGYKTMNTMDGLETFVMNTAAGGLFDVKDVTLMKAA